METTEQETESGDHPKAIEFTVDGEELTTDQRQLTPAQIMTLAKIDPSTHFLTLVKEDRQQESFEGKNDVPITMKDDMVFVSAKTGPTGVS